VQELLHCHVGLVLENSLPHLTKGALSNLVEEQDFFLREKEFWRDLLGNGRVSGDTRWTGKEERCVFYRCARRVQEGLAHGRIAHIDEVRRVVFCRIEGITLRRLRLRRRRRRRGVGGRGGLEGSERNGGGDFGGAPAI